MDKLESLGAKTANVIVGNLTGKALSFAALLVIARLFGVTLFGQYTFLFTAIFIVSYLTRFGFSSAILYFVPRYATQDEDKSAGMITVSILVVSISSLLFAAVFWTARDRITGLLPQTGVDAAYTWFVLLYMAHNLYYLVVQIFRALRKEWLFVLMQSIGYEALKIVLLVLLYLLGRASLATLTAAFALVFAILAVCGVLVLFRQKKLCMPHFSRTENGTHWRYALKGMVTTTFQVLENKIDILLLGYLSTSTLVGVYRVCFQISTLVPFAYHSFLTMLAPLVAELHANQQHADMYQYLRTITKWSSCFGLFIIGLIILFSKDILSVFGPEFTVGSLALIILAFAKIALFMTGPTAMLLAMTGRPELNLYAKLIVIIGNIVLNLLLIPRYGLLGATTATLLAVLLSNIFSLVLVRLIHKTYLFNLDTLKAGVPFIGALLICLPLKLLLSADFFQKAFVLLVYLGLYGFILSRIPYNHYDRILMAGLTRKIRQLLNRVRPAGRS